MAENGEVGTIIVKDVSRFGREQVEMGLSLIHISGGRKFRGRYIRR